MRYAQPIFKYDNLPKPTPTPQTPFGAFCGVENNFLIFVVDKYRGCSWFSMAITLLKYVRSLYIAHRWSVSP